MTHESIEIEMKLKIHREIYFPIKKIQKKDFEEDLTSFTS